MAGVHIQIGDKFGEWTVIDDNIINNKVLCRCSCNKEKAINVYTLRDGRSTNCGHLKNKDRIIDLTGQQFGDLKVIRYIDKQQWECECSCGNIRLAHRNKLISGVTHSCGHDTDRGFINIKDQRFGKLVAIQYVGNKNWLCQCDCGNKKIIAGYNLRNNSTKSCGCLLNYFTKEDLIKTLTDLTIKLDRKPYTNEFADALGVNKGIVQYNIEKYNLRIYLNSSFSSEAEREIASLFPNAVLGSRNVIPPYELDIYIPDKKLAIEYNGTYWHSAYNKDMYYHQRKTIECAKKGIQLIHIFEYEWESDIELRNKILDYIKYKAGILTKERIYARNTSIEIINNKESHKFLDIYHLQKGVDSNINIGLKYNNELVSVMSFGKPRFNNECQYEIYRYCTKDSINIIGGAEKLFNYFINNFNPESIITYSDISKFTGNLYTKLGFKTLADPITKPNYVWVSNHSEHILTRYQTQKHKLIEQELGTENQTEDEIMANNGYYKVYDCGNLKMEWRKPEDDLLEDFNF